MHFGDVFVQSGHGEAGDGLGDGAGCVVGAEVGGGVSPGVGDDAGTGVAVPPNAGV